MSHKSYNPGRTPDSERTIFREHLVEVTRMKREKLPWKEISAILRLPTTALERAHRLWKMNGFESVPEQGYPATLYDPNIKRVLELRANPGSPVYDVEEDYIASMRR